MKYRKLLLVLPAMLVLQNTYAQSSKLTLSDKFPAAAEKIKLSYNPAGTAIDGKKDITAQVYFIDGKDNPVADVDLKANGASLTGEFTIPAPAKAFFVKLSSGETIDNNADKGYLFFIYKDEKPVQGAYEAEAFILSSGVGARFGGIKADNDKAVELFKKEDEVYPKGERSFNIQYYSILAQKKDPQTIALVNAKIKSLKQSNDEKDLLLATNMLNWTKQTTSADSLVAVIRKRFPEGPTAKNDAAVEVYKIADLGKKDSAYNAYIAKYSPKPEDKIQALDFVRTQLASGYLKKGDMESFNKYAALVKNKTVLAQEYNNTAYEWVKAGEKLDEADKLSKQSLDIMAESVKNPVGSAFISAKTVAKRSQESYDNYADTYAFILYKEKKYEEALKYQKAVYATNTYNDPEINEHYVLILNALGKYAESQKVIEGGLKDGKGSDILKNELKTDYMKLKGSQAGYDDYLASLINFAKNKKREELAKQMINQPALPFALKDFEGNSVSLASLKGKVVIVDFWATWCGPCKASFPGMQTAVNKFKDDGGVKFLFIDTWEKGTDYADDVKKFIADKKYSFYVLMDEKGADGRQSKVVSQFGVEGIPTKFILDKNGNIRFKVVGFDGSADGLVDEVSAMIDMAKEPAAAATPAAPAKVGMR